jgi:hypothetical protein
MATMVATDFFCRWLALLQARPYPAWFYTGDDDAGRLARGAEFNPDATTVAQWLYMAMEEKDPMVAFLPKVVTPLCADREVEAMLRRHPVVAARGIAQLPPPPPPGGGGGGQVLGGSVLPEAERDAPESSRGGSSIHVQFPPSCWTLRRHRPRPRRLREGRSRGALPPPPPFRRPRGKRSLRSDRRSSLHSGGRDLCQAPGTSLGSWFLFVHFLFVGRHLNCLPWLGRSASGGTPASTTSRGTPGCVLWHLGGLRGVPRGVPG